MECGLKSNKCSPMPDLKKITTNIIHVHTYNLDIAVFDDDNSKYKNSITELYVFFYNFLISKRICLAA